MNQMPKIIVALDFPEQAPAIELVNRLDPGQCRLKVGKELFTAVGPQLVEKLQRLGFEVFLDLKFHDIPNTVAQACRTAASLGVWMVNVHAVGGRKMMSSAVEAISSFDNKPMLIAVTVLTSMDQGDLDEIGFQGSPQQRVLSLAKLTQDAGLDGVVCSAREVTGLRQQCGRDFVLVTPGVRPKGVASNDQKRVLTPGEAIAAGSDYLVIGRPITQAQDPLLALKSINHEIEEAIKGGAM